MSFPTATDSSWHGSLFEVVVCIRILTSADRRCFRCPDQLRMDRSNPRYFSDTQGKLAYLVGAHAWRNLQGFRSDKEALIDCSGYSRFRERQRLNFFRHWCEEEALWSALPYFLICSLPALDGKPKFDVDEMDPAFFDRLGCHPFHRADNVKG